MTDADRKRLIWTLFQRLDAANPVEAAALWRAATTPDAVFHAVHPMNDLTGAEGLMAGLVGPLRDAIPDLQRRPYALMAGRFKDADWVCAMGVFEGTMTGPWLGIPATDGLVNLRFGEFYRIEGDRIAEVYAIHDLIDLMRQAGINPLPASPAGVPDIFPAPITQDGVRFDPALHAETDASLALVEAMIFGLHKFAEGDLKRMGMEQYWSPNMLWFGPGGIGEAIANSLTEPVRIWSGLCTDAMAALADRNLLAAPVVTVGTVTARLNVAVAIFAASIVRLQVAAVPVQAPPQLANTLPVVAVAVILTTVPLA